jgi:hypothetical protein
MREDWQALLGLFPDGWEELGRSTGAVARLRGFDSLNDLFRTLLLHVGCGWSLRETAVQAKLAGIADVSDVTLLNRLRQSEQWLRQLCQQLSRPFRAHAGDRKEYGRETGKIWLASWRIGIGQRWLQ